MHGQLMNGGSLFRSGMFQGIIYGEANSVLHPLLPSGHTHNHPVTMETSQTIERIWLSTIYLMWPGMFLELNLVLAICPENRPLQAKS